MNWENALEQLKIGNKRYLENNIKFRNYSKERKETKDGQNPFAIVLACSDSRVVPEIIFDQGLGDIFTIRNAGNILSPKVLGSIEYGISQLNIPLILVCGHTGCGAIEAAYNYEALSLSKNLERIVLKILKETQDEDIDGKPALAIENVFKTIDLIEDNKVVKKYKTKVIGGIYDLSSGKMDFIGEEKID